MIWLSIGDLCILKIAKDTSGMKATIGHNANINQKFGDAYNTIPSGLMLVHNELHWYERERKYIVPSQIKTENKILNT
jgi:hypothetical protein